MVRTKKLVKGDTYRLEPGVVENRLKGYKIGGEDFFLTPEDTAKYTDPSALSSLALFEVTKKEGRLSVTTLVYFSRAKAENLMVPVNKNEGEKKMGASTGSGTGPAR